MNLKRDWAILATLATVLAFIVFIVIMEVAFRRANAPQQTDSMIDGSVKITVPAGKVYESVPIDSGPFWTVEKINKAYRGLGLPETAVSGDWIMPHMVAMIEELVRRHEVQQKPEAGVVYGTAPDLRWCAGQYDPSRGTNFGACR